MDKQSERISMETHNEILHPTELNMGRVIYFWAMSGKNYGNPSQN